MSLLGALALVALQAAPGEAPLCADWVHDTPARLQRLEQRLLELVNERRRALGRAPLVPEARLAQVALAHASHLARLGGLAHETETSGGLEDRVRAAGITDWDTIGENLASGRPVNYTTRMPGRPLGAGCHTPDSLALEIMLAWGGSPGHNRTLLDPAFTHVGSGVAFVAERELVYIVHDFARLVHCGFAGAACCPPPAGHPGGVCHAPLRCRAGLCQPEAPAAPPATPQP